jgi:hypothetical protein
MTDAELMSKLSPESAEMFGLACTEGVPKHREREIIRNEMMVSTTALVVCKTKGDAVGALLRSAVAGAESIGLPVEDLLAAVQYIYDGITEERARAENQRSAEAAAP